jgi:thiamine-phosphate pyrophosphorylase
MSARPRPVPGPIYAIADAAALSQALCSSAPNQPLPGSASDQALLGSAPNQAPPGGAPDPTPLVGAVSAMAAAGIGTIQIRGKRLTGREWHAAVASCCAALAGTGVALWLDDRVDLAALFPVAGVHLGQADLPPAAARRILGESPWIGQSTHNERQLLAAAADPEVDLIAVGPVFATTGKTDPDPVVGIDFLRWARSRTAKPLVAIGGIDAGSVARTLSAGADGAAVLGAVCRGDVHANCRRLLAAVAL